MTENETKLQQNEEHIACLKKKNDVLRAAIEAEKEPKWIAAVSRESGDRLILNLAALDDIAKTILKGDYLCIRSNRRRNTFTAIVSCNTHITTDISKINSN